MCGKQSARPTPPALGRRELPPHRHPPSTELATTTHQDIDVRLPSPSTRSALLSASFDFPPVSVCSDDGDAVSDAARGVDAPLWGDGSVRPPAHPPNHLVRKGSRPRKEGHTVSGTIFFTLLPLPLRDESGRECTRSGAWWRRGGGGGELGSTLSAETALVHLSRTPTSRSPDRRVERCARLVKVRGQGVISGVSRQQEVRASAWSAGGGARGGRRARRPQQRRPPGPRSVKHAHPLLRATPADPSRDWSRLLPYHEHARLGGACAGRAGVTVQPGESAEEGPKSSSLPPTTGFLQSSLGPTRVLDDSPRRPIVHSSCPADLPGVSARIIRSRSADVGASTPSRHPQAPAAGPKPPSLTQLPPCRLVPFSSSLILSDGIHCLRAIIHQLPSSSGLIEGSLRVHALVKLTDYVCRPSL